MFYLKPGWTKARVMARIRRFNNGRKAMALDGDGLGAKERCVYRTADGNRCAIGCFIPSTYRHALNYRAEVGGLLAQWPKLARFMPFDCEDSLSALRDFQTVHDACKGNVHKAVERWLNRWVKERA